MPSDSTGVYEGIAHKLNTVSAVGVSPVTAVLPGRDDVPHGVEYLVVGKDVWVEV